MSAEQDELIPTRPTLLERLKDLDNHASWQEFFNTYGPLMRSAARKCGLTEAEAQDAVQETVIAVARHLPGFVYDPKVCSFKSWLLLITRQRIVWQLRKRSPPAARRATAPDDATGTATIDRVPAPAEAELPAYWDAEWQRNLLATAVERVKLQVRPKQFQIFDLYALQHWPAREVAQALKVNLAQVYLAKHRVTVLLKREVARLECPRGHD
ncbi:MAG: sigma-70 family RNA polymerase sigma factor [Verrucomicrobia bacterium]|nr:sigma-70 family RNA polymerase sigma factor [Verrucomicrobiota bacterium]